MAQRKDKKRTTPKRRSFVRALATKLAKQKGGAHTSEKGSRGYVRHPKHKRAVIDEQR